MKELYIEHLKIRHAYHAAKEKMVWLVATVYLGFAFAVIDWIWKNNEVVQAHSELAYLGVSFVFGFGALFAGVQNWYKAQTVVITEKMARNICTFCARARLD